MHLLTRMMMVPNIQTTDEELLAAAYDGNCEAMAELLDRHVAGLYRTAYRLLGNRCDAEDAVQDAITSALNHFQHFEGRAQFSTWLSRIAINSALQLARKRSRLNRWQCQEEFDFELAESITSMEPDPEQLCAARELHEFLEQQLEQLSPALREAFVLRDVEEFSVAETAQVLGTTKEQVRSRTHRARLKLAARLSRYCRTPTGSYRQSPRANRAASPKPLSDRVRAEQKAQVSQPAEGAI